MADYNFALRESDLDDIGFCTGATAKKVGDNLYFDAVGAIAKINGLDIDPEKDPSNNQKIIEFVRVLVNYHHAKHGEDVTSSFDSAILAGKSAYQWFREKGYLA